MSSDRYLKLPPPPKHPPDGDNLGPSLRSCFTVALTLILVLGVIFATIGYLLTLVIFRENVPKNEAVKILRETPPPNPVDDSPAAPPATPVKSRDRLRQIGIAFHAHSDNTRTFPPARDVPCDKQGKPFLSWRVYLLPYLDQQPLYEQFHLNEPWDSPHNRKLLDKMPDVYRSRDITPEDNRTGFVIFQDPRMYHMNRMGPEIRRITDGASNTLLIVETSAGHAVPWTRPQDLHFDPANPLKALQPVPKEGFWGAFADGAVLKIRPDIKPDIFRGLLTFSGKEVISVERDAELR